MAMLRNVLLVFGLLQALLSSSFAKPETCGGTLKTKSGEITSPNYPNNYPDNTTCKWEIYPETTHVNLTFEDFHLEKSRTCSDFDYVKIGFRKRWGKEEVTKCGLIEPRLITLHVKGYAVDIAFHSDPSLNAKGFKIRYQSYDIDPCLENKGGCSHSCKLVKGKRLCSCPSGYRLSYDEQTCRANTSCHFVGRRVCTSISRSFCRDLPDGKVTCQCWSGYRKENNTCKDIDECKERPGVCNPGKCTNYNGYHHCTCPTGYSSYGRSCRDRNECNERRSRCGNGTCVNTKGSYVCLCEPGYKFDKNLTICQDEDECAVNNGGCSHECVNSLGSYSCRCRPGFYLDNDGKTCQEPKIEQIGGVSVEVVCQGNIREISCDDPNKALIIYRATYGRTVQGRVLCPYKGDTDDFLDEAVDCGSKNVTHKVTEMCGWKNRCDLASNSSVLGAFCPGTPKNLEVVYACAVPVRCPSFPIGKPCPRDVPDECDNDKECKGSEMCCHDGCAKACLNLIKYDRKD